MFATTSALTLLKSHTPAGIPTKQKKKLLLHLFSGTEKTSLLAIGLNGKVHFFQNLVTPNYIPMKMNDLNSASFYTLAYHVRRKVEQLIQEQDYVDFPQELADVIECQLLPALKAIDSYEEATES